MKKLCNRLRDEGIYHPWVKLMIIMKLTCAIVFLLISQAFALKTYSQKTLLSLKLENATIKEVLKEIEDKSSDHGPTDRTFSIFRQSCRSGGTTAAGDHGKREYHQHHG